MGNEENRFEKDKIRKISIKSLVKRIILGALAFILIFISIFGYFYFKYGSF